MARHRRHRDGPPVQLCIVALQLERLAWEVVGRSWWGGGEVVGQWWEVFVGGGGRCWWEVLVGGGGGRWREDAPLSVMTAMSCPVLPILCSSPMTSHEPAVEARW